MTRFPFLLVTTSLLAALAALSPRAGALAAEAEPAGEPARARSLLAQLEAEELAGQGAAEGLQASPRALAVYKSKCLVCHGPRGQGDGPGAKALNPKPRSFREAAWQQSVSDDQIRKATTDGGAGVGKSPAMPAVPALKSEPATLDGLVALLRSFKD